MPGSSMTTEEALSEYLDTVERDLRRGLATEHTHRAALERLIESLRPGINAINEPQRSECGAPDFIVERRNLPQGHIECKDVGVPLGPVEKSEQLKRYREGLPNIILTDYLEFRWYVEGEHRLTSRLATVGDGGRLRADEAGAGQTIELLGAFLDATPPIVSRPAELVRRMAGLAKIIRSIIEKALEGEAEEGALHEQLSGFRETLLHSLTAKDFADMYAQTICYGLFAARCSTPAEISFTRETAPYQLPATNPFLRKMFVDMAGPDMDSRILWAVEDLAALLGRARMDEILEEFGQRTRREDPVVHFYETFLAAYDPKMREARGVYYTPEAVVSYIVRSVDHLLKTEFGLPMGLADNTRIEVTDAAGAVREVHKVQILDPATGTGTFLHGVVNHIYESFQNNRGMWPGYVREHLLPRLFGFELLMAPYAVAHLKLSLQLSQLGYDLDGSERINVFLTNTLEEAHGETTGTRYARAIDQEARDASRVKRDAPVMVILGNPPYSGHSENKGEWISGLLRGRDTLTDQATGNYFEVDGQPLGERNPKWLNDDYVKFIRFAQWRIEQTGYGILGFVTNHGYLDNPTFRGMRQSLMQTFDKIYIYDLHGNSKKKERTPDDGPDENVFDIQQGVAICLMVKGAEPATAGTNCLSIRVGSRRRKSF